MKKQIISSQTARKKTKKKIILIEILGCICFVLGFGFLLIPAILSDEQGHYENGRIFLLAFFFLMIAAIVIWMRILPQAISMEMEASISKHNNIPLTMLHHINRETVTEAFIKRGFKRMENSLYRKKKFSFMKDAICYYLAFSNVSNPHAACEQVQKQIARQKETSRNICIILFICRSQFSEEDKQTLRTLSSILLSRESGVLSSSAQNIIPILIDSSTGEAAYLHMGKGMTMYAYGCRLLKKLLA